MNKKISKQFTSKKFSAFIFTLIFILSMFSCFPATVSAATTTVKNIEPTILTNVGDNINLGDYSVEFSDGTVSSDVKWKYKNAEITTFKAEDASVFTLIAQSGNLKQNIYIVSKKPADNEYVLYNNDFTSEQALDGWNKLISTDGVYTIKEGKLQINGLLASTPRILLPSWLSKFGNYRIDMVATQIEATDTSRWFSINYRAKDAAASGMPYYHMCVRNNAANTATSTTGGVECCAYTGMWNYYKSASYTEAINPSKNYTFSVLAKDSVVQYQIDGNTVIHVKDLPTISNGTIAGGIGITANSSKLLVDSIKVTVQEKAPEYKEPEIKQILQYVENPESNILNAPSNIAIIDSTEALQELQESKPSNALMYIDSELNVNKKDGTNLTTVESALPNLKKNIIPAFYVKDKATVDALVKLLKDKEIQDALVISADTEVAKYTLSSYPILRNAIDFTSLTEKATDEKLLEIRGKTTSANSLIAILPASYAVSHNVSYLQSLGVSVWTMDDTSLNNTKIAKMITSGATGIITNDCKKVAESFKTLFVKNTLTKTSLVIGHRGNPTQAPENSISGYLKAIENGADVVETDVKLTKDNKIIIMHDPCISRTTNYTGDVKVSQMTLDEIKKYRLWGQTDQYKSQYPNETVPTFEEMIVALKDTDGKIFLEIKTGDANIIQPLADLIKKHNFEDRIFVICFTASQLTKMQNIMPTLGTGLLCSVDPYSSPEQMHEKLYKSYLFPHTCFSTLNPSFSNISDDFLSALRHRGITCWPWTYSVSAAKAFNNGFIWGIDGLTTNDAQYSKNMVKKLVSSDNDINLTIGATSAVTAEKVTYGRVKTNILEDKNTFVTLIEGEDVAKFENGTITALKEGTASFMLGYKTKTANGTPYVLYTQPFVVNVKAKTPVVVTKDKFPTKTVIIISTAAVLILAGAFLYLKSKKNTK